MTVQDAWAELERLQVNTSRGYTMSMVTSDLEAAAAAIKAARVLRRPLVIKKLMPQVAAKFRQEKMYALPPNLKVFPDDAGLGPQSFSDWLTLPLRYQRGRAPEKTTWGGLATLMSEKGRQRPQFERFMSEDLEDFREASGFTRLSELGALVWGAGERPRSSNIILTGSEVPGRSNKSDAHQDQHDNIMLVSSGSKIWALADLTEEEVKMGKKNGNKNTLKSSLGLDAIDRSKNMCEEHDEVASRFDTIRLRPGDVLYNPAMVWHQVNSDALTLAYSLMFAADEGRPRPPEQDSSDDEEEEVKVPAQQQEEEEAVGGGRGGGRGTRPQRARRG